MCVLHRLLTRWRGDIFICNDLFTTLFNVNEYVLIKNEENTKCNLKNIFKHL